MPSSQAGFDAVVVGGGPAGCFAARQLAVFGCRVALVHSPRRRRQHLGESLSASAPRLLASYGLELPPAVFAPRPADHFVRWGGREERVAVQPEDGAGEGQRLVRRDRLDDWALAEARRAGVRVLEGSAAAPEAGTDGDGTALAVRERGSGELRLAARALVDASGRSGVLTRHSRKRPAWRTTALTAHLAPGDRAGTLIESFSDGWVWSAPVLDGRRDVTVMLDAEAAAGRAEECFREAIRRVDLSGFVAGDLLTPVRAAEVTPYRLAAAAAAVREVSPLLAVGDAASALDPLTGLGTMKAMDSGLTGAVAMRTALERPREAGLALAFHAEKEAGLAAESADRIAAFHAGEHRFGGRPFWSRRSREAPPPPAAPALAPNDRLAPTPGARVERRGVLEADWIVAAEVLVRPGRARPVHRLRGILLPELFRTACASGRVGRTVERFPTPATTGVREEVTAGLSWLVREGFLAATPSGGPP